MFLREASSLAKNKLLLVVNPVSGKGLAKKTLLDAVDIFSKHGYIVTVLPTEPDGKTVPKIIDEAKEHELIVAIGGDGTLNMVAGSILQSGTDATMGYIPLGSTNDFATSLGLSNDINVACEKIVTSEPNRIDIGQFGDKHFVYIACTGMFTSASYSTSQRMKNIFGHSAYIAKGAIDIKNTKKQKFTIELENETIEDEFVLASISNSLRVAGVVSLEKENVSFNDGIFELIMVKSPKGFTDGAGIVKNILTSNLGGEKFVKRNVKKAHVIIESPQGWSLDGENGGEHSDVWIDVKENALNFIY